MNSNEKRKKYIGRFKGTVVNNIDPEGTGRLMVKVPDVLGDDPCIWAESASPLAGAGMGLYFVPPIDSGVWIEFQQGDSDYAMWTGCWRGSKADVPVLANGGVPATPPIVLGTTAQNSIVVSDAAMPMMPTGGIMLTVGSATIVVGKDGIQITAPKLEINAANISITGHVLVNGGALEVLP
ncbi:MAG TPA: phage baseplate assembly protein V [Candidatus Angelobacter sp.]|jgi:hypothetical protein